MAESLYRRKPEGDAITVLTNRSTLLKTNINTIHGKSAQVRDPVYIWIEGICNACKDGGGSLKLPREEHTWDSVYKHRNTIKTGPQLEEVIIECLGDYGLARKISATIRCYKRDDFEEVMKYFLLPGNTINAGFYHKIKWGKGSSGGINDYRVATFNFNCTAEGHWVCNFTAVSAAVSIKNADIQVQIRSKLYYYEAGEIEDKLKHQALSLAQLIAADAMVEGIISKDIIKAGQDYLITSFEDYKPYGLPKGVKPAIKLFHGEYLQGSFNWYTWSNTILPVNDVDKTSNQVYVTLGYLIDRVINDQILGSTVKGIGGQDHGAFSKLKIVFDPILSKSKITKVIKSGDPLNVLLHGPGYYGGRGGYKNHEKQGKNFEENIKEPVSVDGDNFVFTWNILLHRNVVTQAYNDSIKEKEANADKTSLQVQREEVVNLSSFLDRIFRSISDALGGAINLTLIEDPKDQNHLLVVDQNYGVSENIPCVVFNPIDGDGSTRSCVIESNVGSQEYQSTMYMGNSKRGDPMTQLRDCTPKMEDGRRNAYITAESNFLELVITPGHLGKNNFNSTDIQALKSIIGSLYHNRPQAQKDEAIHFPGMKINIDLDGVWGFIPGNAISSTQLPQKWRAKNVYFMVTNVTHTFANNDWQTTLQGIMAYYESLTPVNL